VVVTAIAGLTVFAVTTGASAEPSIDDKRAQAEAILAEINGLGEEVGAAAERYNGASYELHSISAPRT
jgi:hypothetical protein